MQCCNQRSVSGLVNISADNLTATNFFADEATITKLTASVTLPSPLVTGSLELTDAPSKLFSSESMVIDCGASKSLDLQQNGTSRMLISTAGAVTLNTAASQALSLQQNGTNRLVMDASGGIALTGASSQLTDIKGGQGSRLEMASSGNLFMHGGTSSGGGVSIFTYGSGNLQLYTTSPSTGSVGIGVQDNKNSITVSSAGAVTLNTAAATQLSLNQNGVNKIIVASDGAIALDADASKAIALRQNAVDRLTITTAGSLISNAAAGATVSLRQDGTERWGFNGSGAIVQNTAASQLWSARQNSVERFGFDANGAITINSAASQAILLQQNATSRINIGAAGAIDITADTSGQIRLQQGATTRLDITSAGSVLLNAAASQAIELRQAGTARLAATANNEIILDSGAAKGTAIRQGGTDMINITELGTVRFSALTGQTVDSRVNSVTRLSVGGDNVTVTPSSSGTLVVAARGITLPNPDLAAYTYLSNHSVTTVPLVFGESTGSRTFTVSCIVMRVGAHTKIRFRTLATNFIPSAASGQYFACFDSNIITDIYMTGLYNAQITNFRAVTNTTYSDAAIFEDSSTFIILKTLDSTDFGDPANYFGPFNGTTDEWNFRSFDLDIISNNTSNAAA